MVAPTKLDKARLALTFSPDQLEQFQQKTKILIGYLWYFMTTFLNYTVEDFDMVEDIANPTGSTRKTLTVEKIIDDLRNSNILGMEYMADLIEHILVKMPLYPIDPKPLPQPEWKLAWEEFIDNLPLDQVEREEMIEDLGERDYIDYMRYTRDNPYPHGRDEWYELFIPLLCASGALPGL